MTTFTFMVWINGGAYEGLEMEFQSASSAIEGARSILQAKVDFYPHASSPVLKATIGAGYGSMINDHSVLWLGEWEWSEDEEGWAWIFCARDVIGRRGEVVLRAKEQQRVHEGPPSADFTAQRLASPP